MRIIKRGYDTYNAYYCVCKNCGCEFVAEESEVMEDPTVKYESSKRKVITNCPECGNVVDYITVIKTRKMHED